jgi:dTDP-glucose 4,6-dehydratase
MTILVTGGAGFTGGNFVLDWLASSAEPVLNSDKLIYSGNLQIGIPPNPSLGST